MNSSPGFGRGFSLRDLPTSDSTLVTDVLSIFP
jgi:hypothetical protein